MTYSDWRVELSEKYKVFKGLYKIIKTPTVIKAAPKQKLKNAVGISYKKSMGTLDYRRSIFPDYKANRSNRFARIKATPSGDPMADISQNIYKKEGKKSLERRLAAKEKQRQEWLKANNLPSSSSAQPPHFNEGVASLALKGGSKLIPALITGIGAAGTIFQARKTGDIPTNVGDGSEVSGKSGVNRRYKTRKDRNPNKPKRKLSAAEKKIFDAQKKDIMQKGSEDFSTTGLIKRADKFTNQTTRGTTKNSDAGYTIEDVAPTNNVGGGQIAGTVEAGDNPPVKKKKRYIYGGTGSRKMWMNNK